MRCGGTRRGVPKADQRQRIRNSRAPRPFAFALDEQTLARDHSSMTAAHELLAAVKDARRRLAERGPKRLRSDGDFQVVTLPMQDCDMLRDLMTDARAQTVIEIGLAYGSSALAIAEALVAQAQPDARHIIVDAYQDQFDNVGWEALESAGLSEVCTLIAERSQLALPRLVADGVVADSAFVDGSHIFHNVFVDLFFLRELVRPGGLIVLDDCQWPSVATAVRYFELNTGWQAQPISDTTRLRAFRLPDPPVEPAFYDFKPFVVP
jgi:predicted O-methyltransferase YrrM